MLPDDAVLRLPNEATLTQASSELILQSHTKPARSCCGFSSAGQASESIPYQHILSARVDASDILTITYAKLISKSKVQLTKTAYNSSRKVDRSTVESWAKSLENNAWENGRILRNKRLKVLINPAGGKGNAQKYWVRDIQPILEAAGCTIDVQYTTHRGHAGEVAQELKIMDFDAVVCCSGDGLPHEVFNGLGRREDARLALTKLAVVQLPCGSGNALSWNCFGTASPTLAALRFTKSVRMPIDLLSITQHDPELNHVTRTLSFLSQAVGIVADIDLGTENLRWVGSKRFELGFFMRIMGKTEYPCDVALATECETKDDVRRHHAATLARDELLEPERLNAALKEYQMREDDLEHAANAGLPELQYGTAGDPLPTGWKEASHDHMGNFYSGNMTIMSADTPFFPAALPGDGVSDLIMIRGDVSRAAALSMAFNVPNYKFFDMPDVTYRKVTGYRITPKAASGYISIDGESMRHAMYQAEVHKALGTTMSVTGRKYEVKDFE